MSSWLWGQGSEKSPPDDRSSSNPKWHSRTLGGPQFWGDELVLPPWRIQRNAITGHYRLLDARNMRLTWGTWETCYAKLEQIRKDQRVETPQGKAVILLHGLGRSRGYWGEFTKSLNEHGGYTVIGVEYPSTRAEIASHAESLARIISYLDRLEQINIVAHSLGNLVVRQYLHNELTAAEAAGRPIDPRIRRLVMLGPPNHGAAMARLFEDIPLYDFVLRGVGRELADFEELDAKLGSPPCEFAIIAGGKGDEVGWNPLLEGDDDLLVKVEETRLAGARDFRLVKVWHANLGSNPEVMAMSLNFLQHGYFTTEAERQPIE